MVVLASFTQPTVGIRHRQNNTTVYVNDNNLGKGTLYIAESLLSWVSDSGSGFSIEYPHISLHAVSRDLTAFPQECLFLMLNTALGDENEKNGDGEDEDEDENDHGDDEVDTTEIRLVPDDRGMLDAMFHAMNACQALHPDPEDSFSDEDFYEDADEESPVEETGSQMANLSIENMESRGYILDNKVEMGMELKVNLEEQVSGCTSGNNISEAQEAAVGGGMDEEGMEEDKEEDREEGMVEGMVEGMEEGIEGGMVEDMVEDKEEGMAEGMAEGMEEGTEGGMVEDKEEDIVEGN